MRKPEDDSTTRPPTLEEYRRWAHNELNVEFGKEQRTYDACTALVLVTAQEHPFFKEIESFLRTCATEYEGLHGAELLMTTATNVTLQRKSFASAVNKSFRQNILRNKNFPEEPENGWTIPSNWFTQINDLVRARIVCKYIDGPQFLAERLKRHASRLNLDNRYYSQGREEGYYAYHFYALIPVELPQFDAPSLVSVEIQVSTQLQEVLNSITHEFYEERRIQTSNDTTEWKWDIESHRFKAGYLSHTLHLMEAIIVQLRDATSKHKRQFSEPTDQETPRVTTPSNDANVSTTVFEARELAQLGPESTQASTTDEDGLVVQ